MKRKDPYEEVFREKHPAKAFRAHGFHDMLMIEAELGARVAFWLDSENSDPEVHFLGFP